MARQSVSIEELKGVMERAGLPVPSFDQRDVESVGAQEAIAGAVRGGSAPAVEEMKKRYMSQINKIAQMDTKLAGVYGDPSSKLFIEHAGQREKIYSGAANIGYRAAGGTLDQLENAQREVEDKITSLTSLYNRLIEAKKATGGGGGKGGGVGGVGGSELAALQSIFPGVQFGSLEEILGGGGQQQQRPPLSNFERRPPLQSFDSDIMGVDILREARA